MIISSSILKNAVERYQRTKKIKEGYGAGKTAAVGVSAALSSFILVVAIVFFILELLVLFYCISIALNCTQGGPERIVHVLLAIAFTFPYALVMVVFNKCATTTLRSGSGWLPKGSPSVPIDKSQY